MIQAIALSKGNEATKKWLMDWANVFLAWLDDHKSEVRTWDKMTDSAFLQTYVNDCERQGLAYHTITHRLAIIKTAWRLMHLGSSATGAGAPIRSARCETKGRPGLPGPDGSGRLLDWLKDHRTADLWPMATMQAFVVCEIYEAAALRSCDVDLERMTIHVTSTPGHTVKTAASDRVIPLCNEAAAALREAIRLQRTRPLSGELFVNAMVIHGIRCHWRTAGGRLNSRRRRTCSSLIQGKMIYPMTRNSKGAIPGDSAARLRASFATMCSRLGCNERVGQADAGAYRSGCFESALQGDRPGRSAMDFKPDE